MQIHFAIPPNSAFLGLLEEFFFSISNIRKFHHIINQFVKKFSTFPDSPYTISQTIGFVLFEEVPLNQLFNKSKNLAPVDDYPNLFSINES